MHLNLIHSIASRFQKYSHCMNPSWVAYLALHHPQPSPQAWIHHGPWKGWKAEFAYVYHVWDFDLMLPWHHQSTVFRHGRWGHSWPEWSTFYSILPWNALNTSIYRSLIRLVLNLSQTIHQNPLSSQRYTLHWIQKFGSKTPDFCWSNWAWTWRKSYHHNSSQFITHSTNISNLSRKSKLWNHNSPRNRSNTSMSSKSSCFFGLRGSTHQDATLQSREQTCRSQLWSCGIGYRNTWETYGNVWMNVKMIDWSIMIMVWLFDIWLYLIHRKDIVLIFDGITSLCFLAPSLQIPMIAEPDQSHRTTPSNDCFVTPFNWYTLEISSLPHPDVKRHSETLPVRHEVARKATWHLLFEHFGASDFRMSSVLVNSRCSNVWWQPRHQPLSLVWPALSSVTLVPAAESARIWRFNCLTVYVTLVLGETIS